MSMATPPTLRTHAIRGAAWMLPASIGSRGIGLIGTLLLARYLTPSEYGIVMAASIAAITASTVTTFGMGTYLVAHAELSRSEVFHASCWFLATGVAALAGTALFGAPLGRWLGTPALAEFLPLLIVAALLDRLAYIPERILVRHLRFGWLSSTRALGELAYTIGAVVLAARGAGAMAIVWGSLARAVVRFITTVPAVDLREWLQPHRLRLTTLIPIITYGMNAGAASMLTFGMRRWDNLLIGRYFGPGAMGAYNYAYNLADTPATAIGEQVSDIIAASLPKVDRRQRAAALVRSCAMVSLMMLPLSVGLAAIAPTAVETFFDDEWSSVGTMLMAMSALAAARPLAGMLAGYFYASNRPGVVLRVEAASLVAIVAVISTVGRLGILWACASVAGVFVLRALAGMWIVRRMDGVPIADFLRPLMRPLVACLAMVAAVYAVRLGLGGVSASVRLPIEIGVGAVVYAGALMLIARSSCHALVSALRAALLSETAQIAPAAGFPRVLSLSSEFPNPSEPGKGLFVRSRLAAIAAHAPLLVVAPVASLDYANPRRDLLAAWRIPPVRAEGHVPVLHPRWIYPPYGGWMNVFFLTARLVPLVARLRAQRRFDVIDAHFAHPEGIAAVMLGRVFGCPVVVTLRGSELRYRRQRWKRFWMSWALRRADRVIAVSEGLRDLAIELGVDPRRVHVVPNGVHAEVFFRRDRLACRARHGLAPAERVILSAGDLAELKGHHRVIAAVKRLDARGVHATLLIAGGVGRSGRYAGTLRQQVQAAGLGHRVSFLGEVTQASLAELMSAADVFCLASSTEGWPNVVNEALACGTPVVATDVGAVRQLIASRRYGTVVPASDDEALVSALHTALTTAWDHDVIEAWGRSRSWRQVADEVLELLRSVVRSSPSLDVEHP